MLSIVTIACLNLLTKSILCIYIFVTIKENIDGQFKQLDNAANFNMYE